MENGRLKQCPEEKRPCDARTLNLCFFPFFSPTHDCLVACGVVCATSAVNASQPEEGKVLGDVKLAWVAARAKRHCLVVSWRCLLRGGGCLAKKRVVLRKNAPPVQRLEKRTPCQNVPGLRSCLCGWEVLAASFFFFSVQRHGLANFLLFLSLWRWVEMKHAGSCSSEEKSNFCYLCVLKEPFRTFFFGFGQVEKARSAVYPRVFVQGCEQQPGGQGKDRKGAKGKKANISASCDRLMSRTRWSL